MCSSGLSFLPTNRCDTSDPEPGLEKVAVFADETGPTHAARQLADGMWTSRLGRSEDTEHVLEAMQRRLDRTPEASKLRRQTVEHPFATLKAWMGATHFLTKTLPKVRTEMSLHVLAYNLKRAMKILGTRPLAEAIRA